MNTPYIQTYAPELFDPMDLEPHAGNEERRPTMQQENGNDVQTEVVGVDMKNVSKCYIEWPSGEAAQFVVWRWNAVAGCNQTLVIHQRQEGARTRTSRWEDQEDARISAVEGASDTAVATAEAGAMDL